MVSTLQSRKTLKEPFQIPPSTFKEPQAPQTLKENPSKHLFQEPEKLPKATRINIRVSPEIKSLRSGQFIAEGQQLLGGNGAGVGFENFWL